MMAKADPKKYAASLALYEKLVATNPKVERKGATMPYTSLNGHMFSLLTRDGWLGDQTPERCAGSVSQEVQDQTLRAIWNGDEGIRRGAGRAVKEDTGTAEVLRPELCLRRFSQAEADNQESRHKEAMNVML